MKRRSRRPIVWIHPQVSIRDTIDPSTHNDASSQKQKTIGTLIALFAFRSKKGAATLTGVCRAPRDHNVFSQKGVSPWLSFLSKFVSSLRPSKTSLSKWKTSSTKSSTKANRAKAAQAKHARKTVAPPTGLAKLQRPSRSLPLWMSSKTKMASSSCWTCQESPWKTLSWNYSKINFMYREPKPPRASPTAQYCTEANDLPVTLPAQSDFPSKWQASRSKQTSRMEYCTSVFRKFLNQLPEPS